MILIMVTYTYELNGPVTKGKEVDIDLDRLCALPEVKSVSS